MKRYKPSEIEPKWQQHWADNKIYEAADDSSKPKIYATPMLPYPSGAAMHTGHVRNYAIADVVARFYRQKGYNTLTTMAWDAFGLPAENYAIKTGTPPAESTAKNTVYFKQQLQALAMSYDWSREFTTSDPSYYKWTQWLFSLMYERGLAYQAERMQWWCDKCKTVLADEQVVAGKCWRHDGPDDPLVTKKSLKQWFFKITDYADKILDDTDDLNWPEKIKTMQKNWIGRSVGAQIKFALQNEELGTRNDDCIEVFTTRPDTIFGATFLVLAPEHPLVDSITTDEKRDEVETYRAVALKKDDIERQANKEKTGVFTGSYAINPANNEQIPIWIADYVLMGYGTGAIMAVPAHDERDNEFAKKFDLPIIEVVSRHEVAKGEEEFREGAETLVRDVIDAIIVDKDSGKYLLIQESGCITHFVGGGVEDGDDDLTTVRKEIEEEVGYTGILSIRKVSSIATCEAFRLTKQKNQITKGYAYEVIVDPTQKIDSEAEEGRHKIIWADKNEVSKLITWGGHRFFWEQYLSGNTIYADEGRAVNSGKYDGLSTSEAREKIVADLAEKGAATEKVNYKIRDWLVSRQRYWGAPIPIIHCPDHGAVLVPDNQLPVVLPEVSDFAPDGNGSVLDRATEWVNVPCPTCGKPGKRETDTLDGYVCSTWYLHRYTDAHNDKQAFDQAKADYWLPVDFYFGGDHAVAHLLYVRFFQKVLVDAGIVNPKHKEPIKQLVYNGYINAEDGSKMSKSKGNTVDPMDLINAGYGADALRVFELFIAPYDQDTSWNTKGVPGAYKFLNRFWTLCSEFLESKEDDSAGAEQVLRVSNKVIQKVTTDLENLSFNTAVAAMMTAVNDLYLIKAEHGYGAREAWQFALESLAQLLGPFAPHIAEETWHELGHQDSVHVGHWPDWDDKYLQEDKITIVVQVNGKVRAKLDVDASTSKGELLKLAKQNEHVASYIKEGIKKEIYVPSKLINFVV